jgi:hypothetical protein
MDTQTLQIPVANNVENNLSFITEILTFHLRPFYRHNHGSRPCPVCLIRFSSTSSYLKYYTADQFVLHFKKAHAKYLHFSSLNFPTDLGSRLHEAHILYNLRMAHVTLDEDGEPQLDLEKVILTESPFFAEKADKWFAHSYCISPYAGMVPELHREGAVPPADEASAPVPTEQQAPPAVEVHPGYNTVEYNNLLNSDQSAGYFTAPQAPLETIQLSEEFVAANGMADCADGNNL